MHASLQHSETGAEGRVRARADTAWRSRSTRTFPSGERCPCPRAILVRSTPCPNGGSAVWKIIVAALIVLVAGCAVPEDRPIPGVEVQIAQARIDMARGKMSIRVINHTGEPLTVSAAGYSDERLATSPQWPVKCLSRPVVPGICGWRYRTSAAPTRK